ncbi:MAG TPA: RHS repeat-associated core domain-containing protein [Bdellovibrionota bacterium]|nr:RHS repeat-associated core domain-containing protein [Bdellovibrionota bacterium]
MITQYDKSAIIAAFLLVGSTPLFAQSIEYNYGSVPTHSPYRDSYYSYKYDRNGNLTQITDRYTGAVKQRLEYNSLNKLLRATAGTSVTEYRYDANGNRIEKIGPAGTEKYYGLIEAKGSTKTYYYFLGNRRVAQRTIGGTLYFHQQDHLGSASVLTDSSGAVQSRSSYHEFGSIKWQEGAGGISDYTYNDKRWDKETNFYDYGARAYNAKMFKFTTPDSVVPDPTNPQSLNRYAYTKNNPLKYVDPTGHADMPPSLLFSDYLTKQGELLSIRVTPFMTMVNGNLGYYGDVIIGTQEYLAAFTFGYNRRTGLIAGTIYNLQNEIKVPTKNGVFSAVRDVQANRLGYVKTITESLAADSLEAFNEGGIANTPSAKVNAKVGFTATNVEEVTSDAGKSVFVTFERTEFGRAGILRSALAKLGTSLRAVGEVLPGIGNVLDGIDDARAEKDAPGYAREFRESANSPFLLRRLLNAFDFVSNPWPYLQAEGQVQQNLNMCGKEDCGWGKPL